MFNGLDYSISLNMSMAFFHLFWGFPAARSRVVIRLAQGRKAKPNANTRTLRPDKCQVVKSLDSSLRPVSPSQHGIHRHHHQGVEGNQGRPLLGCQSCFSLSWKRKYQTVPSLALSRREGRQRADARQDKPLHFALSVRPPATHKHQNIVLVDTDIGFLQAVGLSIRA